MKKIIFTESQLRNILGEDFTSYLPNKDTEYGIPNKVGEIETSVGDMDSDGELANICTDELGNMLHTDRRKWFRRIYESNQALDNVDIKIPDRLMNDLKNSLSQGSSDNDSYIRIQNIIQQGAVNVDWADKIVSDYKKNGGKGNIIPRSFVQWLQTQLKSKRDILDNSKKMKKDLGFNNAYQKAGGTKGNGVAHSAKTPNGSNLYVEN